MPAKKTSQKKAAEKTVSKRKTSAAKSAAEHERPNAAAAQGQCLCPRYKSKADIRSYGGESVKKIPLMRHQPAECMALEQPIEGVFADMSERLMRIQRDLMMPAFVFERAKIQNTITFFGSAQIKSPDAAKFDLRALEEKISKTGKKPSAQMSEKLERARMDVKMSRYYADAEELASRLQEWSNILNVAQEDKFYIMTGGGPGIMEAANKGARKTGGKTAGLTILIPDEQRRNDYVSLDAWVNFNYFLMRKFWLLFFAKALVVFPGGTGTFDEFFEVVTLMKTRKTHNFIPTVLFGKDFWEKTVDFKYLVKTGVISSRDLSFFRMEDSPEEAANYIIGELERIYF